MAPHSGQIFFNEGAMLQQDCLPSVGYWLIHAGVCRQARLPDILTVDQAGAGEYCMIIQCCAESSSAEAPMGSA